MPKITQFSKKSSHKSEPMPVRMCETGVSNQNQQQKGKKDIAEIGTKNISHFSCPKNDTCLSVCVRVHVRNAQKLWKQNGKTSLSEKFAALPPSGHRNFGCQSVRIFFQPSALCCRVFFSFFPADILPSWTFANMAFVSGRADVTHTLRQRNTSPWSNVR